MKYDHSETYRWIRSGEHRLEQMDLRWGHIAAISDDDYSSLAQWLKIDL